MSENPSNAEPAPPITPLTMVERRVLGVLVEKAKTTPDVYPMSVNGIVTGGNQKSNREPILNLTDEDVENTLAALQPRGFVTRIQGGRVERWRHNLYDVWSVNKVELAILAELLLRGPQTEGELRQRASRMEPIDELESLRSALKPLVERKLAIWLGEEGRRGAQITHGFHAAKEIEALKSRAPVEDVVHTHAVSTPAGPDQIGHLEKELQDARQEIAALRSQVQQVQDTLQKTVQQLQELKVSLGAS